MPLATTKDNYDFTALLRRAAWAAFAVGIEHVGFWDLRVGLPLTVVIDTARHGRERYGACLVLVRPDSFVDWVDDAVTDAARVLERVTELQ